MIFINSNVTKYADMQSGVPDTDFHKGIAKHKIYLMDYSCLAGESFSAARDLYMTFPFWGRFVHVVPRCTSIDRKPSITWHGWLKSEEVNN